MPYTHFKMEGMKNVSDLLNQGDYMVKIDLKDAYWHIPIHQDSRKFLRFRWDRKLYEMGVLAFGVGPGPRIFTKLLKVPLTVLRRLMIKLVAYLDDLLIMGKTIEETLQARDSVLYLFQQLGFTINWEKSVLQPTQEIEFLGMNLNSLASRREGPELIEPLSGDSSVKENIFKGTGQSDRKVTGNTPCHINGAYVGQSLAPRPSHSSAEKHEL